jgi:outer membrane protein OmpA-like peptidoglycan-associated protein
MPWPVAVDAPTPAVASTADAPAATGQAASAAPGDLAVGVPHPFPWPVAGDPGQETIAAASATPDAAGDAATSKGVPHPFPWPVASEAPKAGDELRRAALSQDQLACEDELKRISSSGTILFKTASEEIDITSTGTLDALAEAAKKCAGVRITVEGHTDARGNEARNKALSERRAQAVVKYLANAGVDKGILDAVGHGKDRPIAPNDTEANMAKNRRIEFKVN